MPNYQNGRIYCIRNYENDDIYIGSTTQTIKNRFKGHKSKYKRWLDKKGDYVSSFELLQYDSAYIELVEKYPCNCKEELEKREGEFIRSMDCVNKVVAGRTQKEWREDNKEELKEKKKEYYEDNKDIILEKKKEYRDKPENKKKHIEYMKEYSSKPEVKERKKEYNKEYNKEHKEQIKKQKKEYRLRPEVKEKRKEYEQRPEVKEKRKEYDKNRPNKEERNQKKREYYHNNKEKYKEKAKEYREENKEILSKKAKVYYENNKEEKLKKAKEYRDNNKERIREYERNRPKITCECGSVCRKADIRRHERSKKHIAYISQENNIV